MAERWQIRRGTAVQNDDFVGAEGELTMDTSNKQLRLHDGSTQGGFILDPIVAFQNPSSSNGYTWYRKYASGWVEQGGIGTLVSNSYTANLPVEMADTNYIYSLAAGVVPVNTAVVGRKCTAKTTVSMTILGTYASGGGTNYDGGDVVWEVKGMAA